MVKVYTLDKVNKRQEALEEINRIVKEILDQNYTDLQLIEQTEVILTEMERPDIALQMLNKLHEKTPSNEMLAVKLFNAYTKNNDYQNMNKMSVKLYRDFGLQEYQLASIESTYL